MYAPASVHRDCWSSFKWFANPIFTKDFVHDHNITWKAYSNTTQKAAFKFKQEIDVHRDGSLKTFDELRLWFPVDGAYLYSRIGTDAVKLHYDNGTTLINGYGFNFYGSLDFHKNWTRNAIKLGVQSLSEKCNSDNRLKIDEEYVQWVVNAEADLGSQNQTPLGRLAGGPARSVRPHQPEDSQGGLRGGLAQKRMGCGSAGLEKLEPPDRRLEGPPSVVQWAIPNLGVPPQRP